MKHKVVHTIFVTADTPHEAILGAPPLNSEFPGVDGLLVRELQAQPAQPATRSFWDWLFQRPPVWRVVVTYAFRGRFVLDYEDFEHLIRGGELQTGSFSMILEDMGYNRMADQIEAARLDGITRLAQVREIKDLGTL